MVIAITGKTASGKTTFSTLLASFLLNEGINATLINADAVSRSILGSNHYVVNTTVDYLQKRQGVSITKENFWPTLFVSRSLDDTLSDPLGIKVSEEISDIISSCSGEVCIVDWSMLPKTIIWDMADYKVLLNAQDEVRNARLAKKRVSLAKKELRDMYAPEYDKYAYSLVIDNDNMDFSLDINVAQAIKDAILEKRGK